MPRQRADRRDALPIGRNLSVRIRSARQGVPDLCAVRTGERLERLGADGRLSQLLRGHHDGDDVSCIGRRRPGPALLHGFLILRYRGGSVRLHGLPLERRRARNELWHHADLALPNPTAGKQPGLPGSGSESGRELRQRRALLHLLLRTRGQVSLPRWLLGGRPGGPVSRVEAIRIRYPPRAGQGQGGWAPQLMAQASSAVAALSPMWRCQEHLQGCGGDADRVQDPHVRKDAARAECVDGRGRYAEQLGNFADGEQTIAATWEPRGREQNRSKIFRNRCFWLRSAGNAIAETRMIS